MNIAPFLTRDRLSTFFQTAISRQNYIGLFVILNTPLLYTIYNNTFDLYTVIFCYLYCGIFQGIINTFLYKVSDVFFHGKPIDMEAWKATRFYKHVIFNTDSVYLYILGATTYMALTVLPESIKWTYAPIGYTEIIAQLGIVAVLHDVLFTLFHYIIHKVPSLRVKHLKYHHDCPLELGSSRCTVASDGIEALVRDLYSSFIPTLIIGCFGMPFNSYLWVPYYSFYSLWAMYVHTGVNKYHRLHHTTNSSRNYGLYYITDYLVGTLDLTD